MLAIMLNYSCPYKIVHPKCIKIHAIFCTLKMQKYVFVRETWISNAYPEKVAKDIFRNDSVTVVFKELMVLPLLHVPPQLVWYMVIRLG